MGTNAILVSTKKKLYCDVGRLYNWQNNREEEYTDNIRYKYGKCSTKEAIEIGEYNKTIASDEEAFIPTPYWVDRGLMFLHTLDEDDDIKLVADSDDEYMDIKHGEDWWNIMKTDKTVSEYTEWIPKE